MFLTRKKILIREQQWPRTDRNLTDFGTLMCPKEMRDEDEPLKLGLIWFQYGVE